MKGIFWSNSIALAELRVGRDSVGAVQNRKGKIRHKYLLPARANPFNPG